MYFKMYFFCIFSCILLLIQCIHRAWVPKQTGKKLHDPAILTGGIIYRVENLSLDDDAFLPLSRNNECKQAFKS